MRYERKFRIDGISIDRINLLIKKNPFIFKKHYPNRIINNIYLDTNDYKNYNDNKVGIAHRQKHRIRWYGRSKTKNDNVKLEKKIKIGWVGTKEVYDIESIDFKNSKSFKNYFFNGMKKLPLKSLNEIKNLNPVLMNTYDRQYLISSCTRFRLTIDTNQEFFSIRKFKNNFFYRLPVNDSSIIMEVKYDVQHDDVSSQVTNYFPFSVSKNSKYVNGIEYIKTTF